MADERAARFRTLISEIEVAAERIRLDLVEDVPATLAAMHLHLVEAGGIMDEVSREALDKVVDDAAP